MPCPRHFKTKKKCPLLLGHFYLIWCVLSISTFKRHSFKRHSSLQLRCEFWHVTEQSHFPYLNSHDGFRTWYWSLYWRTFKLRDNPYITFSFLKVFWSPPTLLSNVIYGDPFPILLIFVISAILTIFSVKCF